MYDDFDEMYGLNDHKKADTIKWIVAFALIALLLVGMVIALVKVTELDKTTTLSGRDFQIGGLKADGTFEKNTATICTKEYVPISGLTITVDQDADVQYKVFYYSANEETGEKTFISASENWLTTDLDRNTIPEGASWVRIVIEPTMDAEVSSSEVATYAGQLTIEHNKA